MLCHCTDLWDTENHGYLSFRQLADSIATCPDLNSAVSFEDLIRFAKLDPKLADQPLDRAQFGHLLESLVERAGLFILPQLENKLG